MNVRLKKEFQALFWPWLVAAVVGLLPLLSWMLPDSQFEQSFRSVYILAGAGFVIGIALLSTMPFGEEFSLRTMPMLLSHPVSRWQIWTEKLKITLLLTLTVALLSSAGYLPFWGLIKDQLKVASAFLMFTVCSGAFFTLLTRSSIGGAVLCLFTQAAVLLTTYAFTQEHYYKAGYWNPHTHTESYLLIISLILSPIFLLLGWKLFARLQYAGSADVEISLPLLGSAKEKSLFSFLRVKPGSPQLNLLLKELSFYKPVLMMGYLFAALWIGMATLHSIYPLKHSLLSNTLNGFTIIYVPLVLLVCGCISLGEEKGLGLHISNLTLPVSWKTQWRFKLIIAIAFGLIFGMVLPAVLVNLEKLLTRQLLDTGINDLLSETTVIVLLSLIYAASVSVSFWAATVTNRTIHAAFLAGFTVMVVSSFHTMGKSTSWAVGEFMAYPLDWLTAQLHLPLGWATKLTDIAFYLSYFFIGLLFPLFSWFLYPKQQATKTTLIKSAAIVIITSWLAGFVYKDISSAAYNQTYGGSRFQTETVTALEAVGANVWHTNRNYGWITADMLTDTKLLSPLTEEWMEGGIFLINQHSSPDYLNRSNTHYWIWVQQFNKGSFINSHNFKAPLKTPNSTNHGTGRRPHR